MQTDKQILVLVNPLQLHIVDKATEGNAMTGLALLLPVGLR